MNKKQLDSAMVRAGIDLGKLHLLSENELDKLTAVVVENEIVINAAVQMTRRHMAEPIYRKGKL